jgi:hypothetical protein
VSGLNLNLIEASSAFLIAFEAYGTSAGNHPKGPDLRPKIPQR